MHRRGSLTGGPAPAEALLLRRPADSAWTRAGATLVALLVAISVLGLRAALPSISAKVDPSLWRTAHDHPNTRVPVIVREVDPASDAAEGLLRSLGGTVTHELPIIGSFSATVPARAIPALGASGSVLKVWGDGKVHASQIDMSQYDLLSPNNVWDDALQLPRIGDKYDGTGVTVAVLDTGVIDSPDLGARVVARVDFTPDHDGIDHFGHGTHMAGIIAGDGTASNGLYKGVAPRAKLVSVKVAGANGATDVSVVIAGMQWIVSHKAQYGIRIMNLSYGTDSKQSYLLDPLDYAVEQVWFSGIVVVVAAGNKGPYGGTIEKPGDDAFVITVGAAALKGSVDRSDDLTAAFSSRGPTQDGVTKPDLIAPGISLVSIRAPGSTVDTNHPAARVGTAYFKGTGTSQAAAVISGVVARLLQQDPSLSPDQVKGLLTYAAFKGLRSMSGAGKGLADGKNSHDILAGGWKQPANQGLAKGTGTGSLEASRGPRHVYTDLPGDGLGANDADGKLDLVTGEIDALGNSWINMGWTSGGLTNMGWEDMSLANTAWTNLGWDNTGWGKPNWAGTCWTELGWSNLGWDNLGWDNLGWDNFGWDGDTWN